MATQTSLFKSKDPSKCNRAMGIRSLRGSGKNLRYCQRDAATCQYHGKKVAADD